MTLEIKNSGNSGGTLYTEPMETLALILQTMIDIKKSEDTSGEAYQ